MLRLVRAASEPLWLDELYGFQLGRAGLAAIWRNSAFDPHPPLFYLLQWVAAGFGAWPTEWAWRWLSVLCGTLTVVLLYHLAARQTSHASALAVALMVAVSPAHLFFSQEARPTALVLLLSVTSMLVLHRLWKQEAVGRHWLAWALVALVGLYTSYPFAMVVGVQGGWLLLVARRKRRVLLVGAGLLVATLPIPLIWLPALAAVATKHMNHPPLTPLVAGQSLLGGDVARYGLAWFHSGLLAVLGGLALAGLGYGLARQRDAWLGYHALQLLLPLLVLFVGFIRLLGYSVPTPEAKHLMLLLPSFYVLVALGLDTIRWWLPTAAPLVLALLLGGVGLASAAGIRTYWTQGRSPEGRAVLAVRARLQPQDAVVSLHYSTDAALSFYLPGVSPYTKPQPDGETIRFARETNVFPGRPDPLVRDARTEDLLRHPRVWLLAPHAPADTLAAALDAHCTRAFTETFTPFSVTRWDQCRAPGRVTE